ncbi:TIGR02678 family protein [Pengzhenrongella frigida]|uniref:TIGR02678 family protein n=1 Tax=Pengzhenrongella frigida TaxID=1259133 RepID=A0A4Q5MYS7_9MICO|nr:TIGR02678 family protein [Cellulomonas sp. HLT2-17]RYV50855.1 TIGR02678 family protein [Cellulomonas sp. HLT2-17]
MTDARHVDGIAPRIATVLEERDRDEQIRAARALLGSPLLRADSDPEAFRLARRHSDHLRRWFEQNTGWRLVVDARVVRLLKAPSLSGPASLAIAGSHSARARRGDPPFTRRRYVLLCLALASLERSDPQVSLGRLAENVVLLSRQTPLEGVEFALATRDERSDLAAAIRLLLGLGVLTRVAGDEESFVQSGGDALYDVDRRVLSRLLVVRHGPSVIVNTPGFDSGELEISQLEGALFAEPPAFTDDETNRRVRHALTSRLLEDPVVYYDELDEAERVYLTRQRAAITRRITEFTGLTAEMRAEGIAMVDPLDQLTDLRMPESGTDGHATLLIAEHLAGSGSTEIEQLRHLVRKLAGEYSTYWRRTAQQPGAENAIVADAVGRLAGLGLVRIAGTTVTPRPALHRFSIGAPTIRAAVLSAPDTSRGTHR